MKNEKYMSYVSIAVVLLFVFGGAFLYSDLLDRMNTSNEVLTTKMKKGDHKPVVLNEPKTIRIKSNNKAESKVHIGGIRKGDAYTYLVIEE